MRGAERKLVKTSQHETLHPERAAANRALIAAAPDLLEAARAMLAIPPVSESEIDEILFAERFSGALRLIDAAIAKAEGGDACTD